jgi:hypothetical protein
MAKDPAFLFYDGDAARDVSHMNRLERGAYFDFLQAQRKFGGITAEQARKVLGRDFESCWPALEMVLTLGPDGKYFIEWVRESSAKRAENAELNRKRIQEYWDKKNKKTEIPRNYRGNSTVLPLENENENEIVNEIVNTIENTNTGKRIVKEKTKKSSQTMEEKQIDFLNSLEIFLPDYSKGMLGEFYNYWSEPNAEKSKMRLELEKTWDTERRLRTWFKNSKNYKNGRQPTNFEEYKKSFSELFTDQYGAGQPNGNH